MSKEKDLDSIRDKIDFLDDYIPAMRGLRERCRRLLTTERGLRREIIKLKKELKNT